MSGEHRRWDLLLLDDAPSTRRLEERAKRIAGRRGIACEAHHDIEAVAVARSTVVLLGGNAEARRSFRKTYRDAVAIEDRPEHTEAPECPYRRALSPGEQFVSLGFEGEGLAERGLLERYAKRLIFYASASGDRRLRARLMRALSEGGGQLRAEVLQSSWKRAVRLLDEPSRVRELAEVTLLLAPEAIRPLALEAHLCARRARHDWRRLGAALPHAPVLILYHRGEKPPEARGPEDEAPIAAVTGLDFYTDEVEPMPDKGGFRGSGFRFETASAAPHFERHLQVELPDPKNRKPGHGAWLDKLLDALLAPRLLYGRPLRHYRCTFFWPLDLRGECDMKDKDGGCPFKPKLAKYTYPTYAPVELEREPPPHAADSPEAADAQAYWYFTPAIRELLYECEGQQRPGGLVALEEWRASDQDLAGWKLELGNEKARGDPLRFQCARIRRLRLFRYFNGLHLLAITVEPEALEGLEGDPGAKFLFEEGPRWWRALAFSREETWAKLRALQMNAWLRFTRLARLIFPAYLEQADEGKIASLRLRRPPREDVVFEGESERIATHIPKAPGQALSKVLRALVADCLEERVRRPTHQEFFLDDALHGYRELYDDRLFAHVSYGPAGPKPDGDRVPQEKLRRLFATALYVDRKEDTFAEFGGYNYDPAYVDKRLDGAALALWEGIGQLYGYTGSANVYLGHGQFYCQNVTPRSVHHIYERMLIQALFYQASLRHYARRITEVTGVRKNGARPEEGPLEVRVLKLREEFIEFTNQYWFHELTAQLQGQEIFRRQQEALGLKQEYEFIKDEMERTHEFMEARFNQQVQRIGTRLSWIGTAIAVIGTGLGLVALWMAFLTFLKDYHEPAMREAMSQHGWLSTVAGWLWDSPLAVTLAPPVALLVLLVVGWLLYRWRRKSK